jgi:hypothetical protein
MFGFLWLWFVGGALTRIFRSRQNLLLENLALRQQITVLKHRHPRSKLSPVDRLFWLLARKFWSTWKRSLIVVSPETVFRWHRGGFRLYWPGFRAIAREETQSAKNRASVSSEWWSRTPTWGAPRIHGEAGKKLLHWMA